MKTLEDLWLAAEALLEAVERDREFREFLALEIAALEAALRASRPAVLQ